MINRRRLPDSMAEERERDQFMRRLEDDTEEQPWMVMGDLQFWSASSFAHSLRTFAHERGLPWYVASKLPIRYRWADAPDVFVALIPEHPRASYDLDVEGSFPPFVVEVVSPSSSVRDQFDKRIAYEALGGQEYALFTPRADGTAALAGYRRVPPGRFERWLPDAEGRLWSHVLGLYLVARGNLLHAATPDGEVLATPEQTHAAWRRAKAEAERADQARRAAEAEVERLREELARWRARSDEQ
jgi:hypothetical protein